MVILTSKSQSYLKSLNLTHGSPRFSNGHLKTDNKVYHRKKNFVSSIGGTSLGSGRLDVPSFNANDTSFLSPYALY